MSSREGLTYYEGYLNHVEVPFLVKLCSYMFPGFCFLFLSLKPKGKDLILILVSFIILQGGIQLLSGQRVGFGSSILFVLWYLINYKSIKLIDRTMILRVGFLFSFLFVVFFGVEVIREKELFGETSLYAIVERVFVSNGASDSVIANTIVNQNLFPKLSILYLLDPIINNPLTVQLFGKGNIGQGYEYLQNYNSFSHWISYLTNDYLYFMGHGMGSSYLAEVYLSFGVSGIILISILLGKMFAEISYIDFNDNIFFNSIKMMLVCYAFVLPRSSLFGWINNLFYLLLTFLSLALFSKQIILKTNN